MNERKLDERDYEERIKRALDNASCWRRENRIAKANNDMNGISLTKTLMNQALKELDKATKELEIYRESLKKD